MKTRTEHGFTLIELLIVVATIGIVAAITMPGLLRARMAGNEASAIGSLRAINSADINWMTNCANGAGYAVGLDDLGAAPTAGGQPFISPDLGIAGIVTKSGYNITYGGVGTAVTGLTTCSASTDASPQYFAAAGPTSPGITGTRYFGTSEAQTLFQDTVPIIAVDTAGIPNPSTAIAIK